MLKHWDVWGNASSPEYSSHWYLTWVCDQIHTSGSAPQCALDTEIGRPSELFFNINIVNAWTMKIRVRPFVLSDRIAAFNLYKVLSKNILEKLNVRLRFSERRTTYCSLLSIIFWDVTPCSLLKCNRRFGGTYRLHLQGRRKNFSKNQPISRRQTDYTASHPRRWYSS
jgi:hypothetical protein